MNRLTVRLLLSFALVLILTLAFSTVAFLVVLRAQPVNTDTDYVQLATAILDIRMRDIMAVMTEARATSTGQNPNLAVEQALLDYFEEKSETHHARIILFNPDTHDIIYDSAGILSDKLPPAISRQTFFETERGRGGQNLLVKGQFNDAQGKWLFVEQAILEEGNGGRPLVGSPIRMMVARSYPDPTFRETLRNQLGSGLFFILVQSAMIGMLIAFLISIWMVRWVTRPLVNIVFGAARLAQGDYTTRVPIVGPQETQIVAHAFNDMASRVEVTQQAQRDFLANVSHDLRTPLTSIQGFAQAISEGVAEPDVAEIIYDEASRLNRMVNDLLDLARIQAGRMDMLRKAVQLDTLLNSVGKSLSIKAQKQGVGLHMDIPELPRVAGDGDRLAQVFTNLVDNAVKHTPSGGEVWLRAALDEASKGVVVAVQDTGEGIPAADLPRIFERFYQVDKSRAKSSGTGLGLAITAEIIYAHNGKIWVESEAGKGARFTVWLPQPMGDSGKTVLASRLG